MGFEKFFDFRKGAEEAPTAEQYGEIADIVESTEKRLSKSHQEGARTSLLNLLSRKVASGRERLQKMQDLSHEEALGLNEQYGELIQDAETALKKLRDFETNKLGMQESNEE